MQTFMKRGATVVVLALVAVTVMPISAMAERAVERHADQERQVNEDDRGRQVKKADQSRQSKKVDQSRQVTKADQNRQVKKVDQSRHAKVIVEKRQHHQKAVGHRFRKQDVTIVNNWQARGLARPGRNEVYVVNNNDIYLAAATTLLVKALID